MTTPSPALSRVRDGSDYSGMTGVEIERNGGWVTLLLSSTHGHLRLPAFLVERADGQPVTVLTTATRLREQDEMSKAA